MGERRQSVPGSSYDGQDLVFAQDQELFAVDLDVGPGIFAEEDLVAGLDIESQLGAVLEDLAVAHLDDLPLLGLLLGGVGDDDSPLDGLLFLDSTDQQAVVKRTNLHRASSPLTFAERPVKFIVCVFSGGSFCGAAAGEKAGLPPNDRQCTRPMAICHAGCKGRD